VFLDNIQRIHRVRLSGYVREAIPQFYDSLIHLRANASFSVREVPPRMRPEPQKDQLILLSRRCP